MRKHRATSVNHAGVRKVKHAASTAVLTLAISKLGTKMVRISKAEQAARISKTNYRRMEMLLAKEVNDARKAFDQIAREMYERAKEAFEARKAGPQDRQGPPDVESG